MSLRSPRLRALVPLVLVAAGCQDYNFNPVGHCLIQPGTERVTLSNISTADVLFVVDDSGSMGGEQQKLAANFSAFINNLNATNVTRTTAGLAPIDFHVAVTTTSIFINNPTTAVCRSDCPGASQQVCCSMSGATPLSPLRTVKSCSADSECGGGGATCSSTCAGYAGEKVCCAAGVAPKTEAIACATQGADCGELQRHFRFDGTCTHGNATDGALYPHGDFVGYGSNPRVLHFDKQLYPAPVACPATACGASETCVGGFCRKSCGATTCPLGYTCSGTVCQPPVNRQGLTSQQLIDAFAVQSGGVWQGNVIVGTCGSGEEQGLQASRLAARMTRESG